MHCNHFRRFLLLDAWNLFLSEPKKNKKCGNGRFSKEQTIELEKAFKNQKFITFLQSYQLSNCIGLTRLQVMTWFRNRRAKWRKQESQGEKSERLENEKAKAIGKTSHSRTFHGAQRRSVELSYALHLFNNCALSQ